MLSPLSQSLRNESRSRARQSLRHDHALMLCSAHHVHEFQKAGPNRERCQFREPLRIQRISYGSRIIRLNIRSRRPTRSPAAAKLSRSLQSAPACYGAAVSQESAREDQRAETSRKDLGISLGLCDFSQTYEWRKIRVD